MSGATARVKGTQMFTQSILLLFLYLPAILFYGNTAAKPVEDEALKQQNDQLIVDDLHQTVEQQKPLAGSKGSFDESYEDEKPLTGCPTPKPIDGTLENMLDALEVMQSEYFSVWDASWPTGNDWTREVLGTQVSATISAVSWTLSDILSKNTSHCAATANNCNTSEFDAVAYENLISYYFQQTSAFWYGENFIGLRLQAYDDMLWVVLNWLESIKFQDLHSELHYNSHSQNDESLLSSWHGTQYKIPAAHRARIFYNLASKGWDTTLCGGGMVWSPWLTPYKNAITNELFVSSSISMYLYFPGDTNNSPFYVKEGTDDFVSIPRDPAHLEAAITAYEWLKNSNMTGYNGLYGDGFHIRGWSENDPGTGKCDVFNPMVYTYNQGVILSGLRGLWLATGDREYLMDAHRLVSNVIQATGWPNTWNRRWKGLGRRGVLEDACDSSGTCSQNGHTFKSVFFHHFAELCRSLTPHEELILYTPRGVHNQEGDVKNEMMKTRKRDFKWHQKKCSAYKPWIEHNARAAFVTKNEDGKFGMWWGRQYPDTNPNPTETVDLPHGAIDYSNSDTLANNMKPENTRQGHGPSEGYKHNDRPGRKASFPPNEKRSNPSEQWMGRLADTDDCSHAYKGRDVNDRGRGRTAETQAGALAVFRALYHWETTPSLSDSSSRQ